MWFEHFNLISDSLCSVTSGIAHLVMNLEATIAARIYHNRSHGCIFLWWLPCKVVFWKGCVAWIEAGNTECRTKAGVLANSSETLNQGGNPRNKRMGWILRNIMKETSAGFDNLLDLRKTSG